MPEQQGHVSGIFISPASGEDMQAVEQVTAVAGEGLTGDRFQTIAREAGNDDRRQITLVSQEALDEIATESGIVIPPVKSRRNLITSGIELNALVGQQFQIGPVTLEAVEICQPCAKMGEVLSEDKAKVVKALVHRSGLRARITDGGSISVGDPIVPVDLVDTVTSVASHSSMT